MSAELTDDTTERTLDRVRIQGTGGTIYTIRGDLPLRFDGFRWQFVTDDHKHVLAATDGYQHTSIRAVGVRDGQIRARGIIARVERTHGLTEVLVRPP